MGWVIEDTGEAGGGDLVVVLTGLRVGVFGTDRVEAGGEVPISGAAFCVGTCDGSSDDRDGEFGITELPESSAVADRLR